MSLAQNKVYRNICLRWWWWGWNSSRVCGVSTSLHCCWYWSCWSCCWNGWCCPFSYTSWIKWWCYWSICWSIIGWKSSRFWNYCCLSPGWLHTLCSHCLDSQLQFLDLPLPCLPQFLLLALPLSLLLLLLLVLHLLLLLLIFWRQSATMLGLRTESVICITSSRVRPGQ